MLFKEWKQLSNCAPARFGTQCLTMVVLVVAMIAVMSYSVESQDSSKNDVHIVPRIAEVPGAQATELGFSRRAVTKPIVTDVNLVLVPVTVTDEFNEPVLGMQKGKFQIIDSGTSQKIKYFSGEEAPVSVAVVMDLSRSMKDKIANSRDALSAFLNTAGKQDEFLVVTCTDKPQVLTGLTSSMETVASQLIYVRAKGSTALIDSIYLAITKLRNARNARKALLVISDGGDNHSRYTLTEVENLIKEADVQTFAIGIFGGGLGTAEELDGPGLLQRLARLSGGRVFLASGVTDFSGEARQIGLLLRHQYVLGYTPSKVSRDGKWHKIKVKVTPPEGKRSVLVSAKRGYYAPAN